MNQDSTIEFFRLIKQCIEDQLDRYGRALRVNVEEFREWAKKQTRVEQNG